MNPEEGNEEPKPDPEPERTPLGECIRQLEDLRAETNFVELPDSEPKKRYVLNRADKRWFKAMKIKTEE